QAVRDVIAWVEDGVAPPASTKFDYTADRGMRLAGFADERLGIQPVGHATVEGAESVEAAVGEAPFFSGEAEGPPGAGRVIAAEWDFAGQGRWPVKHGNIEGNCSRISLNVTHRFDKPGTYFPSARVTSHREGDVNAVHRRQVNLARVRVVVR